MGGTSEKDSRAMYNIVREEMLCLREILHKMIKGDY